MLLAADAVIDYWARDSKRSSSKEAGTPTTSGASRGAPPPPPLPKPPKDKEHEKE